MKKDARSPFVCARACRIMKSNAAIVVAFIAVAASPLVERASAQTAAFTTVSPLSAYSDGRAPGAALVEGNDGNYHGTTAYGGTSGYSYEGASYGTGYGTIFQMTPAGVVTILHSFDGTDGLNPGNLIKGPDGSFYGVAQSQRSGGGTGGSVSTGLQV